MNKLFFYRAFALNIASDVVLPQLLEIQQPEKIDITIKESANPIDDAGPERHFLHHNYDDATLWLRIPHVAVFSISQGASIEYTRKTGFAKELLNLTIMSTAIPHVLQQRGLLVFKAMAVEKKGKAYVFVSPTPAGKSFLVSVLTQKGFKLLSDDVVAISNDGLVLPGYNRIKLWYDCLQFFNKDSSSLARVRPGLEKFYLPVADAYQFEPTAIEKIILFKRWNFSYCKAENKKGIAKFMPLKTSISGLPLIDETNLLHVQLKQLMKIAASTPAYLFIRPSRDMKVKHLLQVLDNQIMAGAIKGEDNE